MEVKKWSTLGIVKPGKHYFSNILPGSFFFVQCRVCKSTSQHVHASRSKADDFDSVTGGCCGLGCGRYIFYCKGNLQVTEPVHMGSYHNTKRQYLEFIQT